MSRRLFGLLVLAVLVPSLPPAWGSIDFQGGQQEAVLTLAAPSFEATINFTVPVKDHILNATFNVTGMAALGDPAANPMDLTIRLNDSVIWAFNGTGYGPLGRQNRFSDGNGTARVRFGTTGGTGEADVRLPGGATVRSASVDINATLPKHWEEKMNFSVDSLATMPISFDCAGDVNSDGYDDIIVGAGENDTGGADAGQAYIYFGGPGMNSTPDVTITGARPGDGLGNRVSGAGDVNGDGYDDVLVGAPENDSAATSAGSAYIFFGGPQMDNVADVNFTGEDAYDWFGYGVSGAGDVNGDGYDDVIIGAEQNEAGGVLAGAAYLFFGGKNMDSIADVVFVGNPTDHLGQSVSGAGDLNADGYDDVIVGAFGSEWIYEDAGRAFVYFGGPAMDNVSDVLLNGTGVWDNFGVCVSGVGDVNGDGYADVAVGAADYNANYAGRVDVFFGNKSMDNKPDLVLKAGYTLDYFGVSVSGAGDVNNDGYNDIIVGAEQNNTAAVDSGRAYIFHGGPEMDGKWDTSFNGTLQNQYFGRPVSGAGDVNGDHLDEFLIGGNWGGVSLYHQVNDTSPGSQDPSLSVCGTVIWKKSGYFKGNETSIDFAQRLNDFLRTAPASGNDTYGNYYVDIPLCVSAKGEGNISLDDLSIVYDYDASVPDFSDALNKYVGAHASEQDASGNISVPLKVQSKSAGRVKLSGLELTPDRPPRQVIDIGIVEMDEDTVNSTLVDLYAVFEDDADADNLLNFSIVSSSNSSFVKVAIENNRYVSADASTGEANDNWTGTVEVEVACRDTRGLFTISRPFTILVRNVNDPPIITSSPALVAEPGTVYFYNISNLHGDREPLLYTLSKAPANMTMDASNGTIRWLPRASGIYQVNLLASDGNATDEQSFALTVPNRPAKITSAPIMNASTGFPYSYNMTADDPNLDDIAFSLLKAPDGMDIRSSNGTITWTPTAVGDFDVSAGAWDGTEMAFQNFTIRVSRGNRAPQIVSLSGPNGTTVRASSTQKFSVVAVDADGDSLTYEWAENGTVLGSENAYQGRFPPGNHSLVLRIGDGHLYATASFVFTSVPPSESTGAIAGMGPVIGPVIACTLLVSVVAIGIFVATTETGKYGAMVFFLPLYTRLHKDEVLDNKTRGVIQGFVYADPGVHYKEIMRRLRLANGTAAYHLSMLEREGFIWSRTDRKLKRFYPAGMKLVDIPPRLDKIERVIVETVRESEGLGQREIARILRLPSSTVNRHINGLVRMGVLRLQKDRFTTRCYLADGYAKIEKDKDEPAPPEIQ